MKFNAAIKQVSYAQIIRNFINNIQDDEIFTTSEIVRRIGDCKALNPVRHTVFDMTKQKCLYQIVCSKQKFYTKRKDIAIKFAKAVGGKIEN